MSVLLVGANPGLTLFDGGTVTAFASLWTVDWSAKGAGTAIVLWYDGRVRVLGADPGLAGWLERDFVRHFPEVEGLPWPEPTVEPVEATIETDLSHGVLARAGDVAVRISGVLGRRTYSTDEFDLGGVKHGLSLVLSPCSAGSVTVAGRELPGTVTRGGTPERPSSSAFLAAAEVWTR